jgi:uncharacterized protein (DUF302 family)
MENDESKKRETPNQNYTESRKTSYCMVRRYGSMTFDEILEQLKDSLKNKDFDIIAEMDVKQYLNEYIKNISKLKILMVCHKKTAADLVSNDIQMTTLIPCKISIQQIKDESLIEISIEDTETTWAISEESKIMEISKNVKQSLSEILDYIGPKNVKL